MEGGVAFLFRGLVMHSVVGLNIGTTVNLNLGQIYKLQITVSLWLFHLRPVHFHVRLFY